MSLGAAIISGLAGLLLWADRRPKERKAVLILTIFPVGSGLLASGSWVVASGHFPVQEIVPSTMLGLALTPLMGLSYWKAKTVEERGVI